MEAVQHFVLVHGACHGACPKRLDEIVSISDYVQPLMEFIDSLNQEEKVILVGHSYGGISISLAMEKFPEKILVAVFVSAYMPPYKSPPGTLILEYFNSTPVESLLDCQLTFNQGLENPPTSAIFGPEYMKTTAYKHCQLEDLELGKTLVRPTGLFLEDLSKESLLTKEKYGSVDRVFIMCEEDEVMKEDFQRMMIQNYQPKEVKKISEAGHMVMLSWPREFSQTILDIAVNYK
ncbi:hypothetical protein Patl1_28781 [Pistacia atlantica]|uniref:Uncharacterized protein n=1 Tax=Pistacia atlantica TaxID=434234 RepID=A0ACC1BE28_9ROSI|nr:hypothetical protein Patl1_28781 [Pistacia atlantica]